MSRMAELHAGLGERLERLRARLGSMTREQLHFRPEPGAWSPLQVTHHLYLAEAASVAAMEKVEGRPSRRRGLVARLGYLGVWVVLKLGVKVKNPAPAANPDADVDLAAVERDWREVRGRLQALLERLGESGAHSAAMMHPIAGPLDVEETLLFLSRHLDHHLRQIDRIRRHPRFPAGS